MTEPPFVPQLEDSFLLWKSLCSCKLLTKTQIILFLNKCDLLQAKLMRGVKIRDRVPSYGDRKNDISTATKCRVPFTEQIKQQIIDNFLTDFQQHFKEISRQYSPVPRSLYIHFTSVIVSLCSRLLFRLPTFFCLTGYKSHDDHTRCR